MDFKFIDNSIPNGPLINRKKFATTQYSSQQSQLIFASLLRKQHKNYPETIDIS